VNGSKVQCRNSKEYQLKINVIITKDKALSMNRNLNVKLKKCHGIYSSLYSLPCSCFFLLKLFCNI
jgi:hypothetical protein